MKYLLIISCLLFYVFNSYADDYPTLGTVFNTTEINSITYDCSEINSNNVLRCKFIQTSLTKDFKTLTESLEEAKKEWIKKGEDVFSNSDCNLFEMIEQVLTGEIEPPKKDYLDKMSLIEKKDLLDATQATIVFCDNKNLENLIKIARIQHYKETRTCMIYSSVFELIFAKMDDNTWSAVPEAKGNCGIVQLDRFEKISRSGFTFWNFYSKKAITNPEGVEGIFACKNLDESEYKYSWNERQVSTTCDYIKFGPSFNIESK